MSFRCEVVALMPSACDVGARRGERGRADRKNMRRVRNGDGRRWEEWESVSRQADRDASRAKRVTGKVDGAMYEVSAPSPC